MCSSYKTVSKAHDNFDITNSIININNTNNNVVFPTTQEIFPIEEEKIIDVDAKENQETRLPEHVNKLETELDHLKLNIKNLKQRFNESDSTEKNAVFIQLLELETKHDTFQVAYENQKQLHLKQQQQLTQITNIVSNPDYFLNQTGERAFTSFEIARLKKGLSGLCNPAQLPRLLNEISYAVRFGELQKEHRTKKSLSIQHAISIALKLVREKRWQTPRGLASIMEENVAK